MLKVITYVSIVSPFFFKFWACKLVLISSNVHKESSGLFTTPLHVFKES